MTLLAQASPPSRTAHGVPSEPESAWHRFRWRCTGGEVIYCTGEHTMCRAAGRCGEVRKADLCEPEHPLALLDEAHSAGAVRLVAGRDRHSAFRFEGVLASCSSVPPADPSILTDTPRDSDVRRICTLLPRVDSNTWAWRQQSHMFDERRARAWPSASSEPLVVDLAAVMNWAMGLPRACKNA